MSRQESTSARPARTLAAGREWAHRASSGQTVFAAALLAFTAAAWIETDLRMTGMDAGPGTNPGPLGFYLGTWAVMMAAMMLPAVMPTVLSYREI